jgi:hypothetical protein
MKLMAMGNTGKSSVALFEENAFETGEFPPSESPQLESTSTMSWDKPM